MNTKMSIPAFLAMWSGSAMAIDTLTVGANSGNRATEQIYSEGDISGSVAHVNESDFNSMSVADMMMYDVILIQWASDSSLDVSWEGRMEEFVLAGGGFIFDGDPNNRDDLYPLVTSSTGESCGSPWTFVDSVDGLTDGIAEDFANCHVSYDGWDSSLSELMRDGSSQVIMLYGNYGAGRVILTGPDQDYHASKGSGGYSGNQYDFLIKEINWVSSGCLEETFYVDSDGDGYGNASESVSSCEAPSGYVADATDCDDSDSAVNPGATEICDGIDNDCDGSVDPSDSSDSSSWYADMDGDGYGDLSAIAVSCDAPTGYVSDGTDCDDGDGAVNPSATEVCDGIDNDCDGFVDPSDSADATTWYEDWDGDGYGDPSDAFTTTACSLPDGYTSVDLATDCNDIDSSINPAATEVCDGIDNDCDGFVDPPESADSATWYADVDGDGYGDGSSMAVACYADIGWVSDATDCDDSAAAVNPSATEVCDGIDNDCDGFVDPSDSADATTWYEDWDADGYGDPSLWYTTTACSLPDGYTSVDMATDCDDVDASINPDAIEVCDGVDNDCDGETDPSDSTDALTWYADADGDGYGDEDSTALACDISDGWVADNTDCDDEDAAVNPAAIEVCDGLDNDCDGELDPSDATDASAWYADTDGDGYGDITETVMSCVSSDGWVADSTDCDDVDPDVNPGATEVCDGVDNDCDGVVDPVDASDSTVWYADADGDGFGDSETGVDGCSGGDGYVTDGTDCDDTDPDVNPDAVEVCDGVDNDCSGEVDGADAEDVLTLYEDNDGDGFGMETFEEICVEDESACDSGMVDTGCVEETCDMVSTAVMSCEEMDGYVEDNTDCDDEDADVYPGAPGMDDECVELEDTGSADDTGSTDDTGSADDTGDDGGSDDTGIVSGGDEDADADDDDEGDTGGDGDKLDVDCGCATGTLSGSSPWLAVLGLMALVRRRQD
ncbi:MAG: putative metal-binding motif-containing protein [Myxococcota bacterium]